MALLNPYLNFGGTTRDAMEFYQSVFGGQLDVSSFADFQMPGIDPGEANLIMHSQLSTPSGFTLMAADLPASMGTVPDTSHITVSLSGSEADELRGYWDKLAEGGQVTMPLDRAPWGDYFGELIDKFGVKWLMNITGGGAPDAG
jgi:PhnB protein